MIVNENKIKLQIDFGASINIINRCQTTGCHIIPSKKTLKMWNVTDLKPLGTTPLKVKNLRTQKKFSIEFVVVSENLVGGAVASWLVCSTPERAVRVRALTADIVLCSWARHLTLTVPLST